MVRLKQIDIADCAVIDMFCGVGGLTHGFVREGFHVLAGYDLDPSCKYAYDANNKGAAFKEKDITKVTAQEIQELYGESPVRILVGCAPCQPFSTYSRKRVSKANWALLYAFGRIVREVKPEIVSIENVPELANEKRFVVFRDFLRLLEEEKYFVSWKVVKCQNYGVPQTRTRLVLLASKLGEIRLISETHRPNEYRTVRQIISKLPKIRAGKAHKNDKLHIASKLSTKNMERIQASQPGGSWKDWDENLKAFCHTTENGKTYRGVYGRMEWDRPSPTITTQFYGFGNGRFGHPTQDRAISIREGAMLQSFPKSYKFVAPRQEVKIKELGRHIGNAVPVRLGQVVAKSIKRHLEGING